ncbi:MAG: ribokinase [Herbinix sp.]|nr:ribokinase [Herbinix sp.]
MGKLLIVGSLNMDVVIDVDTMPKPGETIFGKKLSHIPGGKGANQAYACGKLGADVSMIGAVGKDENGDKLLKNLQSVGVDTSGVQVLDYTVSGTAIITVNCEGENSIIVISGANYELNKEHINKHRNLIEECDVVVLQLEIPMETVVYVAELAKSLNKQVILDPAPAPKMLPDSLIKNIDIIKPNETELQTLTGMPTDTTDKIVAAADSLIKRGIDKVVVTVGSKGTVLVTKDKHEVFPPRKVEAVDTTAAGDAFTASLALKLVEGSSIEEAIKFGNIVSSIVVTRKGAQSSIPSYEEVVI